LKQREDSLIQEAGSPEGAKRAIDSTASADRSSDFLMDQFAIRWGFPTHRALMEASTTVTGPTGVEWWATQTRNGRWIVWNSRDTSATHLFGSLAEAEQSIHAE
jgi:hypothetical protein